jgi:NADPH-dependent curcumin reductase CurA
MNVTMKETSFSGFVVSSLIQKYLETFQEKVRFTCVERAVLKLQGGCREGLENTEVAFDSFLKDALIGKSTVVAADK